MANPKKRFKCGGVTASVWENEQTANDGAFTVESVSFSRRYRKSDGEWDSAASFCKNDLPKLQVVCQQAYEFLNAKQPQTESSGEGD